LLRQSHLGIYPLEARHNAWGDIFKVKVSAGAKVGAKVRVFGVAKVGVNADIGSANKEWIYGSGGPSENVSPGKVTWTRY
jgi:hypothetical protein